MKQEKRALIMRCRAFGAWCSRDYLDTGYDSPYSKILSQVKHEQ